MIHCHDKITSQFMGMVINYIYALGNYYIIGGELGFGIVKLISWTRARAGCGQLHL